MKTKRQEIEILHATIAELGPDSYLAPWLSSVAAEVESMIASDFFPSPTLAESVKRASDTAKIMISMAAKDCQTMLDRSKKFEADTYKEVSEIRNRLGDAIRAAERALNF